MNDFHEALELLAYERMSLAKLGLSDVSSGETLSSTSSQKKQEARKYATRLMLVIISALSKLAARDPDLNVRVILCLAKIISHSDYFDPSVTSRATECINLLKFPSIASAVFEASSGFSVPNNNPNAPKTHIDKLSALPFIVQSVRGGSEKMPLHAFEISDN